MPSHDLACLPHWKELEVRHYFGRRQSVIQSCICSFTSALFHFSFSAKLIQLAYGIKVLQIICVVEDEKVSVDDLIEQITEEVLDHVQSVDIVAFNKI
uniref:Translation elongation factor EF1B beta/delta subunit guanine nucleotide exchange domain-containing protein n=1 Tax=Wuchereria bancrofti TaxID=6293 RepID=A0AAF5Q6W8_WUCBA